MKIFKITLLLVSIILFTSCASGYKTIEPSKFIYASTNEHKGVKLAYKYDLLDKKYEKKEIKKGIKLVAVKISNTTERDLVFGKDIKLIHQQGGYVNLLENTNAFKELKQGSAPYLLYLLLSPMNLYTSNSNGSNSSTPIGLVVGPGLALGNIIASSSANKKFEKDLLDYDINGSIIKKGETVYGLVGIKTDSFNTLNIRVY